MATEYLNSEYQGLTSILFVHDLIPLQALVQRASKALEDVRNMLKEEDVQVGVDQHSAIWHTCWVNSKAKISNAACILEMCTVVCSSRMAEFGGAVS